MRSWPGPWAAASPTTWKPHIKYNEELATQEVRKAAEAYSSGKVVSMIVMVLATLGVAGLGFLVYRHVEQSLGNMVTMFKRIEHDLDFTGRLEVRGSDEVAQASTAFNRLLDRLQASFREISSHTEGRQYCRQPGGQCLPRNVHRLRPSERSRFQHGRHGGGDDRQHQPRGRPGRRGQPAFHRLRANWPTRARASSETPWPASTASPKRCATPPSRSASWNSRASASTTWSR